MSDDAFETTVEIQRGTSTDDRDKIRTKVSADSIEELQAKVEAVREHLEDWAEDLREVQPVQKPDWDEDQVTLEEGSG